MDPTIPQPATDSWEAVYYPNPIPLSSRTLLAAAVLLDCLHLPGVAIPPCATGSKEKAELREEMRQLAHERIQLNLGLWAIEQPALADFIHLPEMPWTEAARTDSLEKDARQLLDDTYGAGVSTRIESVVGACVFRLPWADAPLFALTWPFYQARALEYAKRTRLPLVSDTDLCVPPLPTHPSERPDAKGLAQQLAMETLQLVLPPFRSVTPEEVAEFRAETQTLARAFRAAMVSFSAQLMTALAAGASDDDLRHLCKVVSESQVMPALNVLSGQLKNPVKPWYKIAIDAGELALATATSSLSPVLTAAWAVIRGVKIASRVRRPICRPTGQEAERTVLLVEGQSALRSTEADDPERLGHARLVLLWFGICSRSGSTSFACKPDPSRLARGKTSPTGSHDAQD